MLKTLQFVISIMLFLLPLTSCTERKEKTLVIVDGIELNSSSDIITISQSLVGNLIFSPLLYTYNSETAFHNVLAADINILPGNNIIEVKLKDDIKFHSGLPLTSDEIVKSLERIKHEVRRETLKGIEAEVIDRLGFRLISHSPIINPYAALGTIVAFSSDAENPYIGTGPFRFNKWLDNGVELEANDDYFEGAPKLKKIIYLYEPDERKRLAMLLKGDADLLAGISPGAARLIDNDKRFTVHKDHIGFDAVLFFNCNSPVLSDKRIRKAISMSIDRNAAIEKASAGAGVAISSPFSPELAPPRKMKSHGYHPKEAVRLLRDAGWKELDKDGILKKGGKKLKLKLYYLNVPEKCKHLADFIAHQLFEVGIELECIEADTSYKKFGDCDIALSFASYYERSNINRWHSSSPDNFSGYKNRDLDRLLGEASKIGDVKEKREIYVKIEGIFEEDVPAAFLFNPVIFNVVNKKFKGMEKLNFDLYSFYKMKDWDIEASQY